MPLQVQCPNGCTVRMSVNRAGRVVRCPRCKSAIRIPKFTESQLQTREPIPCVAKIAKRKPKAKQSTESKDAPVAAPIAQQVVEPKVKPSPLEPSSAKPNSVKAANPTPAPDRAKSKPALPNPIPPTRPNPVKPTVANDQKTENIPVTSESTPHLKVPSPVASEKVKTPLAKAEDSQVAKKDLPKDLSKPLVDVPVPSSELTFPPMALKERKLEESFADSPNPRSSTPIINLDDSYQGPAVVEEEKDWGARLKEANADRQTLARFFALVLCLVAIVNMVPAIYHWFHWLQLTESLALPRWIYIQIFVGAIHLVYAIFLAQIPDWSAMRAVSVAMLAVAFVFGFVSTGLLIGGGQGNLTGFLGIPYALSRQACIWCVAMLCLATLMSYWGGKESSNWQRAEFLLKDIASRSAA